MGRPKSCNCHCVQCPPYSAINVEASTNPPNDPVEPSDARTRTIIDERSGEGTLTTEDISSSNITSSVSVTSHGTGATSPGSRRVVITATSPGSGPWTAGVILWDDSGYTYDPSVGGSVSQLRAAAGVRYTDPDFPLTRDDNERPDIIFGAVIEQDGKKYFSFIPNGSGLNNGVSLEADECWRGWRGTSSDGLAPWYIGRAPKTDEGRNQFYRIADVVGHYPGDSFYVGRCDDMLITLDGTTGTMDVDDRPDISHDRVSRPITKFGLWIALSGERAEPPISGFSDSGTAAGDYTLDILVDDIYLDMTTWGVHKLQSADVGVSPTYGATLIDEDLTTIPGWTETGLSIIDQNGISEQLAAMANVSLVDGLVGQDSFPSGNEYDAGRIGTSVANPGLTDSSQITLEFTWRTIDPRDHYDTDGTGPDPAKSRLVRAGVWFDTLFRMRAELTGADALPILPPKGNSGWQLHGPPMPDGGTRYVSTFSNVWGGDDYEIATTAAGASSGTGNTANSAASRPMDGDRYTIIARRRYTNAEAAAINANIAAQIAAGNYTVNPPAILVYPEAKWNVWLIVNGRVAVTGSPMETVWLANVLWFPSSTLTFGLIGFVGGRWSDVRLRIS